MYCWADWLAAVRRCRRTSALAKWVARRLCDLAREAEKRGDDTTWVAADVDSVIGRLSVDHSQREAVQAALEELSSHYWISRFFNEPGPDESDAHLGDRWIARPSVHGDDLELVQVDVDPLPSTPTAKRADRWQVVITKDDVRLVRRKVV